MTVNSQIAATYSAINVANIAFLKSKTRIERIALCHYVMALQFKLTLLGH